MEIDPGGLLVAAKGRTFWHKEHPRHMSISPTQLSLRALREAGYHAEVVERFDHFARKRKDLFGFGDILAIREGEVVVVQTTTFSNRLARKKKIMESELLPVVLSAGILVVIHGWHKVRGRWAADVIIVEKPIN